MQKLMNFPSPRKHIESLGEKTSSIMLQENHHLTGLDHVSWDARRDKERVRRDSLASSCLHGCDIGIYFRVEVNLVNDGFIFGDTNDYSSDRRIVFLRFFLFVQMFRLQGDEKLKESLCLSTIRN